MALNREQLEAVQTTEGAVIVIAGPGTGKTKTIVERVCHLVIDKKVPADEILITTFARKASEELRTRILKRLSENNIPKNMQNVGIGNFHQICRNILEDYSEYISFEPGYSLIDAEEQLYLIKNNWPMFIRTGQVQRFFDIRRFKNSNSVPFWVIRKFATFVNKLREGFVDLSVKSDDVFAAKDLLFTYEKLLHDNNAVDFSEQMGEAYRIIKTHPEVREEVQKKCRYLMVDEYQDTNPIQEKIVKILSNKTGNICVVGDDDQSLYRFRGATVHNLLEFENRFNNVKKIYLKTNYRSKNEILKFSTEFLNYPYMDMEIKKADERLSNHRFNKELISVDSEYGNESAVYSILGKTEKDWVTKLSDFLESAGERIGSYSNILLLSYSVRSEKMLKLISSLRERGISLYIPRGGKMIERTEIKRLISFMSSLAVGNEKLFNSLSNQGKSLVTEHYKIYMNMPEKGREDREVSGKKSLEKISTGLDPIQIFYSFFSADPFKTYFDNALSGKTTAINQIDNISTFLNLFANFSRKSGFSRIDEENLKDFFEWFFADFIPFLMESGVDASGNREAEFPVDDRLCITTIHQAKGLEYPIVVVVEPEITGRRFFEKDAISKLPKAVEMGSTETEELSESLDKYRLYYTAFTRAKDLLILTGIDENAVSFFSKAEPLAATVLKEKNYPEKMFMGMNVSLKTYKDDVLQSVHFSDRGVEKIQKAYSYTTDISLYEDCPRKYFFIREHGFTEEFSLNVQYGNFVHEIFQKLNQKEYGTDEEIIKLIEKYNLGMIKKGICFSKNQLNTVFFQVKRYLDNRKKMEWKVKGSEIPVTVSTGEFMLEGRIDLVLDDEKIVDFKTGHHFKEDSDSEQLKTYKKQIMFYKFLLNYGKYDLSDNTDEADKTGKIKKADTNYLYFTSLDTDVPIISVNVDEADFENLKAEIYEIVKNIEDKKFEKSAKNIGVCKNCPMRYFCEKI